jgi:pSer/pThr/pTyr-binding forkhead associated (FHA) protein
VDGPKPDLRPATPRELQARLEAERRGTPFLVYRDEAGAQVLVALGADRDRMTVGRRDGNDVRLGWDAEVSRVHAALERVGDEWVVGDDGLSHNGTWVNGRRVTGSRRLADGDVILVGTTSLLYRRPGAASESGATRTSRSPGPAADLTPAQRRVLVALCRPFKDSPHAAPASNQDIAGELVVSVDAVKATMRALFERFDVGDLPQNAKRAALATRALETGVVSARDL